MEDDDRYSWLTQSIIIEAFAGRRAIGAWRARGDEVSRMNLVVLPIAFGCKCK